MRKIREILRLRHERGLTHRTIAEAVRVGAATVSEYRHSTLLFRLGAENLPVGAYGRF